MPTKSKIRYQIIWICYYLFKIEEKAHTHSIDYVHIWTQLFLLGICWKIPKNSLQLHENLIDSKCSGDFKNVSFRTQKKNKDKQTMFYPLHNHFTHCLLNRIQDERESDSIQFGIAFRLFLFWPFAILAIKQKANLILPTVLCKRQYLIIWLNKECILFTVHWSMLS